MKYRADLDVLRALSIALVVLYHFKIIDSMEGGFLGVDVFFVLSGYLIASISNRRMVLGTFSFSDFYVRRIVRLAPALIITTLFCFLIGWFYLLPLEYVELAKQVVSTQLYWSNFYFLGEVNYFGLNAGDTPLLHTWSLAVEEQFYIFYPLVAYALFRYLNKLRLFLYFLALLISLFLCVKLNAAYPKHTFYLIPFRAWELLVGVVLAFLPSGAEVLRRNQAIFLAVCGYALIIGSALVYQRGVATPGYYSLAPVLGAAVAIYAGGAVRFVSPLWQPFIFIGKISYPLYLLHWPVYVLFGDRLATYLAYSEKGDVGWSLLLLSLCLACLTYLCVEKPLQKRLRDTKALKVVSGYVIALLMIICFSSIAILTDGYKDRFAPEVSVLENHKYDRPQQRRKCLASKFEMSTFPVGECLLGDGDISKLSFLVVGDSHAEALADSLDIMLRDMNATGYLIYQYSCTPLKGITTIDDQGLCEKLLRDYLSLAKDSGVRNVLLISSWRQPLYRRLADQEYRVPDASELGSLFSSSLEQTVADISEDEKQVLIWGPLPGAAWDVPNLMAWEKAGREVSEASYNSHQHEYRFRYFYDAVSSVTAGKIILIDPAKQLCVADGNCIIEENGLPLYFDSEHPSQFAVELWAEFLAEEVSVLEEKNNGYD